MKEAGIPPKKRGRPVGSKKKVVKIPDNFWKELELPDSESIAEQVKDWSRYSHQWQTGFDEGTVCGYESASSDMKLVNRITLVLTLVNVAILISLVIKNV